MLETVWRVLDKAHQLALTTLVVLMGLATVLLSTVGTVLYLWDRENDADVQSVEKAGRVRVVSVVPGLTTRALVETDAGFYALGSGVSLAKGEPMQLQTRGNGRRYLCTAQKRCVELL